MSKDCPKKQNTQVNQAKTQKKQTRAMEIIDDRDDVSEVGSEDTAVSGRNPALNVAKMVPDTVVNALEAMTKEQRDEVLDRILMKGEDF